MLNDNYVDQQRTMAMDNRLTLHELIDNHMKHIDENKRGKDYQKWFYELCSMFNVIYPKITKNLKKKDDFMNIEFDEVKDSTKKSEEEKTEEEKEKERKKKEKKRKKKRDYKKEFMTIKNTFRSKYVNNPICRATYLMRANSPRAHTLLYEFLSEFEMWIYEIMEKYGIMGVSYQNDY